MAARPGRVMADLANDAPYPRDACSAPRPNTRSSAASRPRPGASDRRMSDRRPPSGAAARRHRRRGAPGVGGGAPRARARGQHLAGHHRAGRHRHPGAGLLGSRARARSGGALLPARLFTRRGRAADGRQRHPHAQADGGQQGPRRRLGEGRRAGRDDPRRGLLRAAGIADAGLRLRFARPRGRALPPGS